MWLFAGESVIINLSKVRSFGIEQAANSIIILKVLYDGGDNESFIVSNTLSIDKVRNIILNGIEDEERIININ